MGITQNRLCTYAVKRLQISRDRLEQARPRGVSMSPRCGDTTARSPQPSAMVFLRWPPKASSGLARENGNSISSGAFPRPSRIGLGLSADDAIDRIVCLDEQWGGRDAKSYRQLTARRVSAMLLSVKTGSPLMLPDVATSGAPKSREQQMMKRTVRKHGTNFTAVGRDLRCQIAADILRHQHDGSNRIAQHGFVDRMRSGSACEARQDRAQAGTSLRAACPVASCVRVA